jgi:hypothetical protein
MFKAVQASKGSIEPYSERAFELDYSKTLPYNPTIPEEQTIQSD